MKLTLQPDEVGRFLLAYYRNVFPKALKLGAAFLFYYGLIGFPHLKHEQDDDVALNIIKEEFVSRVIQ